MSVNSIAFPVLGQVALGYAPMIDRQREVAATRLTVFPTRADAPPSALALLKAVASVWPPEGARVSLNVVSETLLHDLMQAGPPANVMFEIPAFMAAEIAHGEAIRALHQRGNTLLLKGRPLTALPREVLPCFAYSIVDLADERRDGMPPPGGVSRQIPHVQEGVRTIEQMNQAFARGAYAVLGWPVDDAVTAGHRSASQPQFTAIVELIKRVDRGDDIDRLEAVMKHDPTLAFKLLRYLNSPLFGLSVEVTSFRHAIMLLGYARLKRWLALLLVSAGKDPNLKPVLYAAVCRGLLMEELGRGSGDERRGEMFICGVFSLLDRMMRQPFAELLNTLPVPEGVRAALVDEAGPYHPYLELVRAVEAASVYDIRAAADALLVSVPEVNQAVLRALSGAGRLE